MKAIESNPSNTSKARSIEGIPLYLVSCCTHVSVCLGGKVPPTNETPAGFYKCYLIHIHVAVRDWWVETHCARDYADNDCHHELNYHPSSSSSSRGLTVASIFRFAPWATPAMEKWTQIHMCLHVDMTAASTSIHSDVETICSNLRSDE